MHHLDLDFSLNLPPKNALFLDEISNKNYFKKTIMSDSEFDPLQYFSVKKSAFIRP